MKPKYSSGNPQNFRDRIIQSPKRGVFEVFDTDSTDAALESLLRDILRCATCSPNVFHDEVGGFPIPILSIDSSVSAMFSSEFPEENGQSNNGSVTLTDETGRSLDCYIEHSLEVEGSEYLLLMPVDAPIEIVAWSEEDEDEATLIEDEEEIDLIFSDAQAVLAEQNLTLKRTAYTLTVSGELPAVEEDEILTIEIEEDNAAVEPEEFQFLANFYHEEQEYGVYTPLDPLLFFAQRNTAGQAELLSPEEFQKVQPLLEELLFEELE